MHYIIQMTEGTHIRYYKHTPGTRELTTMKIEEAQAYPHRKRCDSQVSFLKALYGGKYPKIKKIRYLKNK